MSKAHGEPWASVLCVVIAFTAAAPFPFVEASTADATQGAAAAREAESGVPAHAALAAIQERAGTPASIPAQAATQGPGPDEPHRARPCCRSRRWAARFRGHAPRHWPPAPGNALLTAGAIPPSSADGRDSH